VQREQHGADGVVQLQGDPAPLLVDRHLGRVPGPLGHHLCGGGPVGHMLQRPGGSVTELPAVPVGAVEDTEQAVVMHHRHGDHGLEALDRRQAGELVGDLRRGAVVADPQRPAGEQDLPAETGASGHDQALDEVGLGLHRMVQDDLVIAIRLPYPRNVHAGEPGHVGHHPPGRGLLIE
jgi:hypothetical protein